MKVLHVLTAHRGGGGAEDSVFDTMAVCRQFGMEVNSYIRSSDDLSEGLGGKLEAAITAFYSPSMVRNFVACLESFAPDVVHIYDLFPLVSPAILGECTRRGIPVVMTTVHLRLTCPIATHFRNGAVCTECVGGNEHRAVLNNCRNSLSESGVVALYNFATSRMGSFTKHIERFIAPSEFTRQWLIRNAGIPAEKVMRVTPVLRLPATAADPAQGKYVAFAGRFAPEKGIATALEAARITRLPFRFCRSRKFLQVEMPSGAEVCTTHGPEELAAFYRGARMLVFPSIWFETYGKVPAEAASHGIPVVASNMGSAAELLEGGKLGPLFEPGNAVALAEQVQRLWDDPELCRQYGAAARAKVLRECSAERHFESLRAVYEAACGVPEGVPVAISSAASAD